MTGSKPERAQRRGITRVLEEVRGERYQQHAKWGQQNHPNGTGAVWEFCSGQHAGWAVEAADDARRRCQEAPERTWGDTYALILNEEVAEAFAEDDPARLRTELIQVAAVAVAWVEAIDRRAPKHRSNRLEDSCSLACNAGYEDGGDCSTYLGRHDAQPFVTAINVISRLYARQLDAYCIGDPA